MTRPDPTFGSSAEGIHPIAVVVASFRDPALLRACLDSLEGPCKKLRVPIVVARAGDGTDVAAIVEGRPGVTIVPAGCRSDVPGLRGVGMRAAPAAEWVALTEDHCLAHPSWLKSLLAATGPGVEVVGGAMGNARPGTTEWAAYFSEYGFFSCRRTEMGEPPLLTGANVAYSSRVVTEVTLRALRGEWENTIHRHLHDSGAKLRWTPEARILQNGTYAVRAFCRDRFEHGHDYARTRLSEEARVRRWLLLAGAPLLPFVLTARVGRAAAGEAPVSFLRSLPLTALFLGAWSLGEAVGYLRGTS